MTDEPEYVEPTPQEKIQAHREDITRLQARIEWHLKHLRELVGPFEPGQVVRVPGNGRMNEATVIAADKAFGDWVVKVTFDHHGIQNGREYIYPASVVEAVE